MAIFIQNRNQIAINGGILNKIIIIAGSTASGKSSIAVKVAKELQTDVISADSMQIYKRMDIGTAKITPEEANGVTHRLINIVEPDREFSVAQYVEKCEKNINELINSDKTPIICGGTGLFIDGLIFDFGFGIQKDEDLRLKLTKEYDKDGGETLYTQLVKLDPLDASKFHKNNKQRLIRAIEIYLLTGKVKSDFVCEKKLKRDVELYIPEVDRAELYARINNRVDKMMNCGLIDEVSGLLQSGITFDMQSMQGIGYKEFKEYFNGTTSINEVTEMIKQNTRNYAKRQITWFKKYDFAKVLPSEMIIEQVFKNTKIKN